MVSYWSLVRQIEADLGERITVEYLANSAGFSRSHFSRAFQAATGEPPQEFIVGRRLCRARDLLSGTGHSIADVAAETGFTSHAHLSTAFKKRLGVSPAKYRKPFNSEDDRVGTVAILPACDAFKGDDTPKMRRFNKRHMSRCFPREKNAPFGKRGENLVAEWKK